MSPAYMSITIRIYLAFQRIHDGIVSPFKAYWWRHNTSWGHRFARDFLRLSKLFTKPPLRSRLSESTIALHEKTPSGKQHIYQN